MTQILNRSCIRVAFAFFLAFVPLSSASPAAAADPAAFVATVGARGVRALAPDLSKAERIARLGQVYQDDFDVAGIGTFALGRYRSSATPQEQQEFFRVYPDFTVRALSSRLDDYEGASFRVTGSRVVGSDVVVNSDFVRSNGVRVPFDWHLTERSGQYKIADVVIGGVSMKIALRDQFASWIESNGHRVGALLTVLHQQVARAS